MDDSLDYVWSSRPGVVDETVWPNEPSYRALQFSVQSIDLPLHKHQGADLVGLTIRVKRSDLELLHFFNNDTVGYMIPRDVVTGNVRPDEGV